MALNRRRVTKRLRAELILRDGIVSKMLDEPAGGSGELFTSVLSLQNTDYIKNLYHCNLEYPEISVSKQSKEKAIYDGSSTPRCV